MHAASRPTAWYLALLAAMLDHMILHVAVSVLVPLLAAVGLFLLNVAVSPGVVVIGFLWAATNIIFGVWFKNHRQRRRARTLDIAASIAGALAEFSEEFVKPAADEPEREARTRRSKAVIKDMLHYVVQVWAYRVPMEFKGASVLLPPRGPYNNETPLAVFAAIHHSDDVVREANRRLTVGNSLAGLAMLTQRPVNLQDVGHPDHVPWLDLRTKTVPTKACIAVPLYSPRQDSSIGALCLDATVRCPIGDEDFELMTVFASRIGWLVEMARM